MPVFNGEKFLRESISSILYQTFENFEFIIINDGSTDNSEAIIFSYNDYRIKYVKNEENLKLVRTLNRGLELAKGQYIARMDADDISMPDRFQKQIKFLEENTDIGLCGTWYENFGDITGKANLQTQHDEIVFRLLTHFEFLHPSWMMRNSIIKLNNLRYNTNCLHGEDYDFVVSILKYTKVANIPEYLVKYRQFNSSMSKANMFKTNENSDLIRMKLFSEFGVDSIDLELLNKFRKVNYQNYDISEKDIDSLELLFMKIIKGNSKLKLINIDLLNGKLFALWFNICYNTTFKNSYKRFNLSPIVKDFGYKISNKKRIKFLVKSIYK